MMDESVHAEGTCHWRLNQESREDSCIARDVIVDSKPPRVDDGSKLSAQNQICRAKKYAVKVKPITITIIRTCSGLVFCAK